MTDNGQEDLMGKIEKIRGHLTPERWERIQAVSRNRTRYLSVVLENLYYTQNMSAIVRSCDAMGIQEVHVVGRKNSSRINVNVAQGAGKWVDLHRNNKIPVEEALGNLKARGYRLVATLPGEDALPLYELDVGKGRIALLFGQEVCGLSPEAKAAADEKVAIPMEGFADSFNVSVSVGICLYELKKKLWSSRLDWRIRDEELLELQYRWVKRSLKHGDSIEKAYEAALKHPNCQ